MPCASTLLLALVFGFCEAAFADAASQVPVRQGITQFEQGQYQEALGSFISALHLDPHDEKALYWQGRAAQSLKEQRRLELLKQGSKTARDGSGQAEEVKRAGILCERASRALQAGDLASAAALYQESRAVSAKHVCGALGLSMTRQALERKMGRGQLSAKELRVLEYFFTEDGALRAVSSPSVEPKGDRSALFENQSEEAMFLAWPQSYQAPATTE